MLPDEDFGDARHANAIGDQKLQAATYRCAVLHSTRGAIAFATLPSPHNDSRN